MRLQLVSERRPPDLLELPWSTPLESWEHPRLVRMARARSRHVVRFVTDGERVFALKETGEADARREFAMLRRLQAAGVPSVRCAGLVTGRQEASGDDLGAVVVTRYLDYALPFTYLFAAEGGTRLGHKLIDAAVVLLVRLHLEGFFWGDCSLANLLFRRDAGALMAYLVDAETTEEHEELNDTMRDHDLDIARENIAGGLFDLQAAGRLTTEIDPTAVADELSARYADLWSELTTADEIDPADRHLIEQRIRRLNDLGFDIGELVVEHEAGRNRLRVQPTLIEEGHHARELRGLTGLEVQENQARRLLNDITSFGAHLDRAEGREHAGAVVAARWIAEVYEPLIEGIPTELRGRREPPELFHELLEHRYFLSEAAGAEVDNATALGSYLDSVLPFRPDERLLAADADPDDAVAVEELP